MSCWNTYCYQCKVLLIPTNIRTFQIPAFLRPVVAKRFSYSLNFESFRTTIRRSIVQNLLRTEKNENGIHLSSTMSPFKQFFCENVSLADPGFSFGGGRSSAEGASIEAPSGWSLGRGRYPSPEFFVLDLPRNGAFCVHSDKWLDNSQRQYEKIRVTLCENAAGALYNSIKCLLVVREMCKSET